MLPQDGLWCSPGVVPVLVGPLQVLLTLLPGILVAVFGGLLGLLRPSGLKNAVKLLWRQKIAAGCIILVGAGIVYGVREFWPSDAAGPVTAAQMGTDWPTARGNAARTGAVPGQRSPARSSLNWAFRPGDEGFLASPAVVGNRVYIASARIGAFSKSGAIYCLDADTGAVVWQNAPEEYRATFSSPVIAGSNLVCGEGLHDTRDARVVCLDLREGKEGQVRWTFRTNNHVECTPVVADGRVYDGAGDDGYYCLDLEPDAKGEAKVLWHKPGQEYPDAETSLAVFGGKVYAGLGNAGHALVVLDAKTGAELRRIDMPHPVFSPASIAAGKLYIGMGNGDYVVTGEGGEVRCLDLNTLKTDWSYPLPQTVLGAVAIQADQLYFGCADHHVYCLSRAGKLVAKFNTFAPIKTSPAVTDEHVIVANDAGMLFCLDKETLEPVWDFRLGSAGLFISSPVAARGHVYVGTQADGLLSVGKPASSKQVPYWSAPLGGAGVAGNSDGSPLPDSASLLWQVQSEALKVSAAPAIWSTELFVPAAGTTHRGVVCLPLTAGEKNQTPPPKWKWTADTGFGPSPVGQSPVLLGNLLAVVEGPMGTDRFLWFLDRATGETRRKHAVQANAGGILSTTLHQFLVQDDLESLTSFDADGRKQWQVALGRLDHPVAASESMIVAAVADPRALVALDRAGGAELWRTSLTSPPVVTPVLGKTHVYLATTDGLEKRSLLNGENDSTWAPEAGVPRGAIAVAGSFLVIVNEQGEVVAVDRATGNVSARVAGAVPGTTPLVCRGKVIYSAPGRLMTFMLGQGEPFPEPWLEWPAKETVATALLLRDGQVIAVLRGGGLAVIGRAP